ncbi:MAG: copper chaperone PCu(A)C [Anaerolineae bacterium]|nr:copper chaperone PCu(A)C [Anaerolineae bacterium]
MRIVHYMTVIVILLIIAAYSAMRTQAPQDNRRISVDEAWVRPALTSGNSAAYLTITNDTDNPVTLTSIAVDFAAMAQVHQTIVENDMAQMQQLENGLRIGTGETIRLQPDGYHIMLMDVQQVLNEGETVSLILTFDNGETLSIEAQISNNIVNLE